MASLDYLVATFDRNAHVEAREPNILASLAQGKPVALYGYKGMTRNNITYEVSMDGKRSMVAGTGANAHDAATMLQGLRAEGLSIARLDVQETVVVDNPDRTIMFLSPKKVYDATRVTKVNGEGETLYVGSPKSRARLRIYNKSAEAGIEHETGKYLRIEVQLRDRYADQAYNVWLDGRPDAVLAYWVGKMLDDASARDVLNLCQTLSVQRLGQGDIQDDDWIARRKMWFERSVVPAMAKLMVMEPDYLQVAIRLLAGNQGTEPSGADGQVSD
ncbi:replication initiation factor domain-containing protein [Escherichia coli]|uniref:replication initiation factor domain-containing protein n=2 Tax=Escherichia coli TaxID=562 RepID=UPI00128F770E|nr:replication initiation factor domain-containing protein [Escherichia coli]MQJ93205.1 hypothetical protein [Escherichia coli]